jgi:hypothetical protein
MVALLQLRERSTAEITCPKCRRLIKVVYALETAVDNPLLIHVICIDCQRPIRASVSPAAQSLQHRAQPMRALPSTVRLA